MSEETTTAAATTTDSAAAATGTTISTGAAAGVPKTTTTEGTKTPEEIAAEQAAKADATPAVPEKYEFNLPEGMPVDTEGLAAFEPIAKDLKLTQEQAQKLVDLQVAAVTRQQEAQQAQVAQWLTDLKADKDLGGANLSTTAKNSSMAVERFGDQALKDLLNTTGLGNHPAFVRWAAKVGAAMAEDKVIPAGGPTGTKKSAPDVMYDKTPPR
jgi:hypothetical protein